MIKMLTVHSTRLLPPTRYQGTNGCHPRGEIKIQTEAEMSKRPVGTGKVARQMVRVGKVPSQSPLNLGQARRVPVPCSETSAPPVPPARSAASWLTLWWRIRRPRKKIELKYKESMALPGQSLNLDDSRKLSNDWRVVTLEIPEQSY